MKRLILVASILLMLGGCSLMKESKTAQNLAATGVHQVVKYDEKGNIIECAQHYNNPKDVSGNFQGTMAINGKEVGEPDAKDRCWNMVVSGSGGETVAKANQAVEALTEQVNALKETITELAKQAGEAIRNFARPNFAP